MIRLLRFSLRALWACAQVALFLAGALAVGLLATWSTVNDHFEESEVQVPAVLNLTLDEADALLAASDLDLRVEARRHHETARPGTIFFQDPAASTLTRRDRRVQVVLSLGPKRSVVPVLAGQSARRARLTLGSEGLATGDILQVHSPTVQSSGVVAQEPPEGLRVQAATEVDLLVSLGPRKRAYVMPDFRGRTVLDAELVLESVGMRVSQITERTVSGMRGGLVHSQLPVPGSRVLQDSAVSLVVSRHIEPTARELPRRPRFRTR